MTDKVSDNDQRELRENTGLLQYRVQDKAYWNIFRKYFGALLAAILAMVLAKPDAAKSITLIGIRLSDLIYYYFLVGAAGLLLHEYAIAVKELLKEKGSDDYPVFVRKLVFIYLVAGISIGFVLLKKVME